MASNTTYPKIYIRFSKSQSPYQKGRRMKTAQFEGYVDTRSVDINNEIYSIDIKTPYLSLGDAINLEKKIDATNGGPFYLYNNNSNLGLFRVRPFQWTIDEKPTLDCKVRSLQFKVEKAFVAGS